MRIGLLGLGTVGRAVADAAPASGGQVVAALVRDPRRHAGATVPLEIDGRRVLDAGLDVVVEALGGTEPARTLVAAALARRIPVVTANKSLMAAHGRELRARAAAAGVPLLFEAAVVAGVPFVNALATRPNLAAPRRITGILNGTSHAILTAVEGGRSFADALADAQARGYAEPDAAADVSGRDAAEKLAVLLQLCGRVDATAADVTRTGIDVVGPDDLAAARALGGSIKPIAYADLGGPGGAWVSPAFVPADHLFGQLSGVTNGIQFSHAIGAPVTFIGPGAGPAVTAQTLLDDVHVALAANARPPSLDEPSALAEPSRSPEPPLSAEPSWFLHVLTDASLSDLVEFLALRGAPARRAERTGNGCALLTLPVSARAVDDACASLRALGAGVTCLPAIEVAR